MDEPLGAVAAHDTILDIVAVGTIIVSATKILGEGDPVSRVDCCFHQIAAWVDCSGLVAENAELLVRPSCRACLDFQLPAAEMRDPLGSGEAGLIPQERCLGRLALGDVDDEEHGAAVR